MELNDQNKTDSTVKQTEELQPTSKNTAANLPPYLLEKIRKKQEWLSQQYRHQIETELDFL